MPHDITDAQFDTEVLKSTVPVIVDFWAPWCGPCRALGPALDELSAQYEGKVKFVKMNVDENGQVAGTLNVMSIPTVVFFKDGQPKTGFVGARPKEDIKKEIDAFIA